MKTVGIIAEYNPLHNGHVYQIQEAKKHSGADCCVVVMSTWAVQRGETAFLSVPERVDMALTAGADAVFALPALWSVRDAEHFALGGISLLGQLGVDALSFGAECGDGEQLRQLASLLEQEPPELQLQLKASLEQGLPYPAALSCAAEQLLPGSAALLDTPNNTLSLAYLRAIQRLHLSMEVYPVHRSSSYHDEALHEGTLPSATALRKAITEGRWDEVQGHVPAEAFSILQQAKTARMERLDAALLYRLRTMPAEALQALPGMGEGLENRLRTAASQATSRQELLQLLKTKRYPYARLSRLLYHALLGMTQKDENLLPDTPWLLGFRDSAIPFLQHAKAQHIPICSKATDFPQASRWLQVEQTACDLFHLAAGQPTKAVLSQKCIKKTAAD